MNRQERLDNCRERLRLCWKLVYLDALLLELDALECGVECDVMRVLRKDFGVKGLPR